MKHPPYDHYPEITEDAISLRQVRKSDLPALLEISFYDGKKAESIQDALEMQERIEADYQNGTSIHWGIVDPKTQEIVGTCGYYRGFDLGIGELGCILRPQFQGRGFMNAALRGAIRFGQENLGLDQIVAITTRENTRAIKLLESLNFVKTSDLDDGMIHYQFQGSLVQRRF